MQPWLNILCKSLLSQEYLFANLSVVSACLLLSLSFQFSWVLHQELLLGCASVACTHFLQPWFHVVSMVMGRDHEVSIYLPPHLFIYIIQTSIMWCIIHCHHAAKRCDDNCWDQLDPRPLVGQRQKCLGRTSGRKSFWQFLTSKKHLHIWDLLSYLLDYLSNYLLTNLCSSYFYQLNLSKLS